MILRVAGEGQYTLADPVSGLEFRADYVRRDSRSGELSGELSVSGGIEGVLSRGTFNFSSVSARSQRGKLVKERLKGPERKADVLGCLEAFCQYISDQERTGEPAVILRDVPSRRPEETTLDVLGLKLPAKHLAILFGAGGTCKSYLALFGALTLVQLRRMRVLYVDWELDAADHRYRLECISDGDMPDGLLYRHCTRPLVHEIDSLRRIGKAENIGYYILDSVGYGTQGDPAAADAAMDFCRAAGQLGGGVLALAHITKNGENNDQMPYGSVFFNNSARATYNVKLASETGDSSTLGIFNRKSNLGRRQPPIGLTVRFDDGRVSFQRTDIGAVEELASSVDKWQRIVTVLRAGPQTLATIASELNESNVESLDRYIRRYDRLFHKIKGPDRIMRVALVERAA